MLRKRRWGSGLLITALTAALIGPVGPATAAPTAESPTGAAARTTAARTAPVAAASTVTLLTGDRVTVTGKKVAVRPGEGRTGVSFVTRTLDGHLHVVPSDALPLLRAGRLDPRLFDVTTLIGFGYDDSRDNLPLIVKTNPAARGSGRSTVTGPGVSVTRDLPAVDGFAARASKTGVSGLWQRLTGASARTLSGGVSTVWLDGLRKPSLDVSVPQIGAPEAWRAGFDGAGTKVAVLDTGVDAGHPDLAGQVVAASNFTEGEEDAKDRVGHGTHVASTIAGTGKASAGKYTGVAPKAKLLDGKVCVDAGCAESWIVAGMRWAAEQGADVANLSLGGWDTPVVDPLEEAVNTLTAEFGTLFVIAAGNDGSDGSVSSPATADAALAVGAVDKTDALAEFSSKGPRNDGALKPEITAPGVDIVAANSADGFLGTPGQPYTTLSGTSMATPHVAGAAAILAQRHPDASPADLKSLLMASAKANPELGAYAQGAGRVDVGKAVGQSVSANPPAVSFGRQLWPHADDAPVTRTITYRNSGTEAVTLALAVRATGSTGAPVPARMFSLSASSLTVPAGGTASVTMTADTRTGAPDAYYTGQLTATGGGTSTTTPFAVDQEVESYDVTVRHLDRTGAPTRQYFSTLLNTQKFGYVDVIGDTDTTTVRVPKGTYSLLSMIDTGEYSEDENAERPDTTELVQPKVSVTKNLTITLDARRGKPLSVTVPRKDVSTLLAVVLTEVYGDDFSVSSGVLADDYDHLFTAQLGPNRSYPWLRTDVSSTHARIDAEGLPTASPVVYTLSWRFPGRVPTGMKQRVTPGQLALVRASHARQGAADAYKYAFPSYPDEGWSFGTGIPLTLPSTRTEYVNTAGQVAWEGALEEVRRVGEDIETVSMLYGTARKYRAGERYAEQWNKGVFGPSLADPVSPYEYLTRSGDLMVVAVPTHGDAGDRAGFSTFESAAVRVFRDGTKVAESADSFAEVEVPAAAGRYRVEQELTRGAPAVLSTTVSTAWTFGSAHVEGEDPVRAPISVVRFTPELSQLNTAPAGRAYTIPVTVRPQPGSTATRCAALSVKVSYDDGLTWVNAPVTKVGGNWRVRVRHPDRPGFVSLRASARDTAGNTVEQTIIRAYQTVR